MIQVTNESTANGDWSDRCLEDTHRDCAVFPGHYLADARPRHLVAARANADDSRAGDDCVDGMTGTRDYAAYQTKHVAS